MFLFFQKRFFFGFLILVMKGIVYMLVPSNTNRRTRTYNFVGLQNAREKYARRRQRKNLILFVATIGALWGLFLIMN